MDTPIKPNFDVYSQEIIWGTSNILDKKHQNSDIEQAEKAYFSQNEEKKDLISDDNLSLDLDKRTLSNEDFATTNFYDFFEKNEINDEETFFNAKPSLFDLKSHEDCEDLSTIISKLSYDKVSSEDKTKNKIFNELKVYNNEDFAKKEEYTENLNSVNDEISAVLRSSNSIFNSNKVFYNNNTITQNIDNEELNFVKSTSNSNLNNNKTALNSNFAASSLVNNNRSCNSNKIKKINMTGRVLVKNESPFSVNIPLDKNEKNITVTKKSNNTLTGINAPHRIERVSCVFK